VILYSDPFMIENSKSHLQEISNYLSKEQLGQFVVPPIVLMLNDPDEEKRITAL
jgi:hypothetical protein